MLADMFRYFTILWVAALALCPQAAVAGPPEDVVQIEVLPGWQTASGTQMAAIRLTLAPGWKTYWRAPGEGGIPPAFGWAGSQNIASTAFQVSLLVSVRTEHIIAIRTIKAELHLQLFDQPCAPF